MNEPHEVRTGSDPAPSSQDIGVFVINLDRDVDRLRQITWTLANLKIPFARWRATSGDDLLFAGEGLHTLHDGIELARIR